MKFKRKERGKKLKVWLLSILVVVIVLPLGWLLFTRYEGWAPSIQLDLKTPHINAATSIKGAITDRGSGLRKLQVAIVKNGREIVLKQQSFSPLGPLQGSDVHRTAFSIPLNPKKRLISDGKATLKITAWDFSWRNWFTGNQSEVKKPIVIDTTPPRVTVLTHHVNITQGGAGLMIYRLSEPCAKEGIVVGDQFFPGYSGYYSDPNIYIAFFALGHLQGTDTPIYISAVDLAGNSSRGNFYYHIRKGNFKKGMIHLSDSWLTKVLPQFANASGFNQKASPLDQFLFVNRELRKRDNHEILSIGQKTDTVMHWSGRFDRLPDSAREAGFADHRSYIYNGKVVDHEYHLGIDLASVANAPIPAANAGRVAFVGRVGIYGNLVCIDHGFGLFSIYGHLSRINVKVNDSVAKGSIIGYTGSTGLAGGDHLHFGIFIDHEFVNPIEWWDPNWIRNNITDKLESVGAQDKK